MEKKWNERYQEEAFAYGTEPNQFFKEQLLKLKAGSLLMPADGEGRNGVFAACKGWQVTSCDLSVEGKLKATKLAEANGVALEYIVGDLEALHFEKEIFDTIGLIYAHFSAEKKSQLHKKLDTLLKPGGIIILEAFSKNHIHFNQRDPKIGGPKNIDMLYSKEEVMADFKNYKFLHLEEKEIQLNEGKYHIGTGSVIRFIGRKPIHS